MYEVEVKVEADHEAVEERLAALGARREASVVQRDTYYSAPHREFAETDEALRIRRVIRKDDDRKSFALSSQREAPDASRDDEEFARVTYKGPLVEAESKTREEHEVGVADDETMAAVLSALGFTPVETVEKERDRYTFEGYTITVDSVTGVGDFVEVETEAAEDDIERAREGAYEILRKLDLDPDETIRTSYLELLLDE